MKPTVTVHKAPANSKAFRKRLFSGLGRYNRELGGVDHWKPVAFEARSPSGKPVGGLFGNTYWGWLYISVLWIHGKYRAQKVGTELLRMAEAEALRRKCKYAHLDSFTFQAPGFYKKLGYKEFGRLDGLPQGHSRIFLYKKL